MTMAFLELFEVSGSSKRVVILERSVKEIPPFPSRSVYTKLFIDMRGGIFASVESCHLLIKQKIILSQICFS